jgi:hypothetical protein
MSPYQQDVIGTTLQEYDIQAQKGLPATSCNKQLLQEPLVVVEKVFKEQSINQHQIETELHYKHNYYNKVLVKHKD